jgi:hypothetical protein
MPKVFTTALFTLLPLDSSLVGWTNDEARTGRLDSLDSTLEL